MSGERHGEWEDWPFEPLRVLRALDRRDVDYVLIGGVAAVLQGSPLPTYDVDITPAPGARNRARLLAALADLGAITLTDVDSTEQALAEETDLSFYTPFGHIDVHHQPAGFTSYAELRRGSRPIPLASDLTVSTLSLRDIVRSRIATGETRQLPALETALELSD